MTVPKLDSSQSYDAYLGPGYPVAPGIGNVFFAPVCDMAPAVRAFNRALSVGDSEGKKDASIRILAAPATFVQAVGSLIIFISDYITACRPELLPFALVISPAMLFLGLAICGIEIIFEGTYVARSIHLLLNQHANQIKKLSEMLEIQDPAAREEAISRFITQNGLNKAEWSEELESLKQLMLANAPLSAAENILTNIRDEMIVRDLSYLNQKYFSLSEKEQDRITRKLARGAMQTYAELEMQKLTVKKAKLARRVMPWCAKELQEKISPLVDTLRNPALDKEVRKVAIVEARNLLECVSIQNRKKLIVHTLGLLGIFLSAVGIILTILGLAFGGQIVLGIALVLLTLAFFYAQGSLENRGWTFSWKKAIVPNVILRIWDKYMNPRTYPNI